MSRDLNVTIFKDTEHLVRSNDLIKESVQNSINKQMLILEKQELVVPNLNQYNNEAKVIVSKKRTYEAAKGYTGQKVAVLNFASASNPGGGVVKGASAQEECLCRCSGLYFCLDVQEMWDGFYGPHRRVHDPIHNDDIIYTPGVTVFKTDTANPVLMKKEDWYEVDVITCAAPNLRANPSNSYNNGDGKIMPKVTDKELLAIHEKRLRRILDVAVSEGVKVIILGAFGCGAFSNNPEVVAHAAKNVIKEYRKAFEAIEFAVYCSLRDDRNYKTFDRVLKPLMK